MRTFKKIVIVLFSIFFIAFIGVTGYVYVSIKKACEPLDHVKYELKRKEFLNYLTSRHSVQTIKFSSKDGIELSGFLIKRPKAKRVILICHGYRQAKEFLAPLVDLFDTDTILLFDFRGQGESSGNRITFGCEESFDIHAALEELTRDKELKKLPVYGLGISMGAVALIKATYEQPQFKAIVLDSSYAILKEQADRAFRRKINLPKPFRTLGICIFEKIMGANVAGLNACQLIQAIKTPVLIIHSESDKITPICDAHELYKRAGGYKELWLVKDAYHAKIFTAYPEEYKRRIINFFEAVERI